MDLIGYLRRIMNMNAAETFDPATDSLEAIANALGIGPSVGLWMFGHCAVGMVASTITIVTDNLGTHLPDDVFNNEFWMQVIHNADAPGAVPEREWRRITNFVGATQTFTVDAFGANVEENDLVCIVHESVLSIEILGFGTLTVSSTTVPADGGRAALYAWENDNYFNGCLLMPTEGDCRFQPRRIVDFTRVGGIFTLDPNNPFSQLPGLVDYIIIADQTEFIPAVDAVINRTPADVIGGKADTAIIAPDNVSSIIRYLKGILNVVIGAVSAGKLTTFTQETVGATNANGVNWVDILDRSATGVPITQETHICGFTVTEAGGWAGAAQVRIVDGTGNKIFPFQAEYQRGVDFADGAQAVFNFKVIVSVDVGYKFQFRSTAAGDVGPAQTLTLNNLDVIEVG